jgi:hypothetical protein
MKSTLTLISVHPEQNIMKLQGTDVDNEKYALIQKFHVSSTTGPVNMWYSFLVGLTNFCLSNAICLVGHFCRGDKTTPKTENVQPNTSTATSVANVGAVLTIDNPIKLT